MCFSILFFQTAKMATQVKLDPLVIANVPPEIMHSNWLEWKDALIFIFDANDITGSKKKFSTMMAYGGLELQRLYKRLPKIESESEREEGIKSLRRFGTQRKLMRLFIFR